MNHNEKPHCNSNSKTNSNNNNRTISALVRGIHDTGTRDVQTLHLPLFEEEEVSSGDDQAKDGGGGSYQIRRKLSLQRSGQILHNHQKLQQHQQQLRSATYNVLSPNVGIHSSSPYRSLPKLIISIDTTDAVRGDPGNAVSSLASTPHEGDEDANSHQHGSIPGTPHHSPGRRFSHLNFALRRFSHASAMIHGNLNRYGDSMGSLGHRAILQYVDTNDLSGLRGILDSRNFSVDDRDENGASVLMVAAGRGLTAFAREFISRGADVNAEDVDNWTPLLCAAKGGYHDIVQTLLSHGADIEHRDMGGWTALMWASYRGHTELVRLLLEKGADVNSHGNYHLGPLLWAAGRGFKEIVDLLLQRGAKVNVGDKYGTTALVWACRKGNIEIVDTLLKAGANVDTAGMYSWTPLLVASSGGHTDCVTSLLEKRPNVNSLDKDGMTSLAIACREGYKEIASALIAAGAYINIQDRAGDTPLIHAVKGGHRGVVEALLKKHADVDIQGKDRKTAIYMAVEKGHTHIVKVLLLTNPDLESPTKDGDTPLLRAVRNRNLEIVQMLLDRKAKVGASDKRGDTCLHIAMRARSKAIVEALLRNPKNSQLLYRANKTGETPYGIDNIHQKTILGQVFGARRLNTNEDSEGMLGYELYSSALADVLSEPTLTTPITVGLYAKWGSGKSFLLNKLREEMNSFARQWAEPPVKTSGLLFLVCLHMALILGSTVGLSTWSALWGSCAAIVFLILTYLLLAAIKYANNHLDMYWAYSVHHGLEKRIGKLRLILQVAFCHPPGAQADAQAKPVRFHFAEASSASPTGEGAIAHMLAALFEAIEGHYGSLSTRLYRAFRPKALKASSGWRWRRMCCVPNVIIFELGFLTLIAGVSLIVAYFSYASPSEREEILVSIYVICAVLATLICTNLHILAKTFGSLFTSQGRHLRCAVRSNEGAPLTALGSEVSLMTDMVKCLDTFTKQQSRLVGVVDALDSCDTERTLSVLSAIQTLLSAPKRPFVLLIAVDPHVIAKAVEANSRRLFTEGGIGGHDFLRNLVHLPVYLQNSGLRKVQRAQMTALQFKRNCSELQVDDSGPSTLGRSVSARRLSNVSEIMSSQEKIRGPGGRGGAGGATGLTKKLRLSESVASSIGSNLHRLGQNPQGVLDLSKIVLTDDYFSDVNPRSMRRLMNVIYITVRLLKAFQIDFSWYRLSSWINLTEQWPLRASMIVLQHDQFMDTLEDSVSLQSVYEKVRPKLGCLREAAPLLELDRDERKLDAFLQLHKSDLLVADLRIFLPFTINLDPYLRKVLKEDQQTIEDEGPVTMQNRPVVPPVRIPPTPTYMPSPSAYPPYQMFHSPEYGFSDLRQQMLCSSTDPLITPLLNSPIESFGDDILQTKLSDLTVDGIISLIERIEDLKPALPKLGPLLKDNAISGRVLKYCDINDLKAVLGLNFGHWELFRLLINTLRDCEKLQYKSKTLPTIADVPAAATTASINKDATDSHVLTAPNQSLSRKNSASSQMEKQPKVLDYEYIQVTLEEQMICGALQTLNEEAFEDVASSERPSPSGGGLPTDDDTKGATSKFYTTAVISSTFSSNGSPPLQQRRDSILKHQREGSVKTDKRVSIKQSKALPQVEYVCEKSTSGSIRPTSGSVSSSERRSLKPPSGPRPASLVITKNDKVSQFKLVRSSSVDYEDIESQHSSRNIATTTSAALVEQLQEDESAPLVYTVEK